MNSHDTRLSNNDCSLAARPYVAPIPPPASAHGGIDDWLSLIQRYGISSPDIFDTLLTRLARAALARTGQAAPLTWRPGLYLRLAKAARLAGDVAARLAQAAPRIGRPGASAAKDLSLQGTGLSR